MPFPETKRVVYKNNPLNRVICQLRYPPILKIESEVPSQFQDIIRVEYPLYSENIEIQQEIAAGLKPRLPEEVVKQFTKTAVTKNHAFSTEDGAWTINLTRTFLSISTSNYVHWEDFIQKFRGPYEAFLKIYNPPFFTRLGLRYVDIFDRSNLGLQDVDWTDLLQPYFLGLLSSSVGKEVKACQNAYEIKLADNESVVRIVTSLVLNAKTNEQCYMVDSDFYTPKKIAYDKSFDKLDFLHYRATRLIRWIITDRLNNAMEPQEA